jgi:parvulin-like peptidyl-prolyl isomerase
MKYPSAFASKTLLALALAAGSAFAQAKPAAKGAKTPPASIARPATSPAAAGKTGPVAVTVAGTPIRKAQIDTLVAAMARSRGASVSQIPSEQVAQMRKLIATNLIGQELLALEAKAKGVQAAPAEIDSALKMLRAQFPDAATYQRALRQNGETEAQVREKIARQIRNDKVLAAHVKPPQPPTDAEVQAFWEKNKSEFPVNDSLRALQIVLLSDPKTDVADQKRRLENVRRELMKEEEIPARLRLFMQAAARQGEGPEARVGGDLQRFHPDDFNAEFRKQATSLRVGEVSPVFQTPLGVHLVMVIEKFDGKFDSYRLHTLQYMMAQRQQELGLEMRSFLKKLAAKYPVKYALPAYKDNSEAGIY